MSQNETAWYKPWSYRNNNNYYNQQQQCYMEQQAQIQKTKEIQMFKEQVTDTFESITIAAEMSQSESYKESIVNRATDGAILALNAWLVSCNDMRNNKNALKIAEKEINDKWNELEIADKTIFDLTIKHRDYMIAAIHGEAKKFNRKRSDPSKQKLFDTNTRIINETYSRLIAEQQKYDEHIKTFDDPDINKKLQEQHANDLKIIRNKKLNECNKYKQAKQSELYFTKSGKNATFKPKNHQKNMDNDLFGTENAYDKLPNTGYKNALFVTKNNNGTKYYFLCLIMEPVKYELDKICVQPAYPQNNHTRLFPVQFIECNVEMVEKFENIHISQHGKLGYKSIKQQKDDELNKEDDVADQIMNGDVDIMESQPNNSVTFERLQKVQCIDKKNQKRNAEIRAVVAEAVNISYDDNQETEWIDRDEWQQRIFPRNEFDSQQKESMDTDS